MHAPRPIDDMFEGHVFLILGVMFLAILNVLVLARIEPVLLTAIASSVTLAAILLVTAMGWGFIDWGMSRFMRAAIDMDASREIRAFSRGPFVRAGGPPGTRRRIMLTRVLPL